MSSNPRRRAAEAIPAAIHKAARLIHDTLPFLQGATAHLAATSTSQLTDIEQKLTALLTRYPDPERIHPVEHTAQARELADQLNDLEGKFPAELSILTGLLSMVPTDAGRSDFTAHGTEPIRDAHQAVRKAATLCSMLADPDYHPGVDAFLSTDPSVMRNDPHVSVYRHPLDPDRLVQIVRLGERGTPSYQTSIEYDVELPA